MTRIAAAILLLALAAGAEDLVVRVTVGDEPVEGANIAVQPARDEGPTFRADQFAPDARTDASGQALVQATAKDRILVYVPGYELAVVRGGGQVVDVALRPERVFSGRVVDTKGDPIVGAVVRLRTTFRRKAAFLTVSGEEGRFHVYGLWFDDYALRIEAPGFVPEELGGYPGWGEHESITEADSGKAFALTRVATVAGTVRDQRGEPVAGAEVRATAHGLPSETARTDAAGKYRITGLWPGSAYLLEFPLPWGGSSYVFLDEGEVREGVDIVRLEPATLRLRVVDAEGHGLAGVSTELASPLGRQRLASNAEGFVEVRIPPHREGEMWLWAEDRANVNVTVPSTQPGATRDLGDVLLRAFPEIEVRVRRPDGTPAVNGSVGTVPLVDGVARVRGWKHYDVLVPGYPPVRCDVGAEGPVVITLPTPRWLEGIVVDTDGGPVAGAQVRASSRRDLSVPDARSDADGRFSVGPFSEGPVEVEAHTATATSGELRVALADGLLELTVWSTKPDLVRGRVLRGDRPVQRFSIEGKNFVDEEGRFEILVHRAAQAPIEIYVDFHPFFFTLPPEGQELVARLPGGSAVVAVEGAGSGKEVALGYFHGFLESTKTGDDGLARFADLGPGVYHLSADGYATTEFTIRGDGEVFVTLPATPQGYMLVRLPPGFPQQTSPTAMNPGVHRDLYSLRNGYKIAFEAVRIVAGEETVVDLAPDNGGSLLLRGPRGTPVEMRRRLPDATVSYKAHLEADGTFRFPLLPPGAYTVRAPLRSLQAQITAGETTVLDLGTGAHVVADRVLLWNGKPAQGATVELFLADGQGDALVDVTDLLGRFRFGNVLPGVYSCVADLDGYASASGTVTVAVDGIETDGLPLTLARSADQRARVVGLAGEAASWVAVRVDGRWEETDALGRLVLRQVPARVDVELDGFAAVRGLVVYTGDEIRLVRGATLVVLHDPEAGLPVVRIGGQSWRRLRPRPLAGDPQPGRLRLEDLPPGPVEIQLPAPVREGDEAAAEPPEPVLATLESGAETIVDLRSR